MNRARKILLLIIGSAYLAEVDEDHFKNGQVVRNHRVRDKVENNGEMGWQHIN